MAYPIIIDTLLALNAAVIAVMLLGLGLLLAIFMLTSSVAATVLGVLMWTCFRILDVNGLTSTGILGPEDTWEISGSNFTLR
jgi:hypothetical protein